MQLGNKCEAFGQLQWMVAVVAPSSESALTILKWMQENILTIHSAHNDMQS